MASFEHEDNDTSAFEELRPIISNPFTDRISGGVLSSLNIFKAKLVTMMSGSISSYYNKWLTYCTNDIIILVNLT
jgi:hypothetical protein